MTLASTMQSVFNTVAGTGIIGNTVTVYINAPTLNAYGDETVSYGTGTATTGIVAPLSEEEVQNLPEGRRSDSMMNCYLGSSVTITPTDKISFNSENYEVESVQNWRAGNTTILKKLRIHKIQV